MSNYQEGTEPSYGEGHPPAGGYADPAQGGHYQGASATGGQYPPGQYGGGPGHPQQTQQFSGYGGATSYRGGYERRGVQIRSTFKTTEFWIFVVVALGALIAAAVTDETTDGQGFSAFDAWRLVTVLAVGYMISRGLTKFRGHEHDCSRHESDSDSRD